MSKEDAKATTRLTGEYASYFFSLNSKFAVKTLVALYVLPSLSNTNAGISDRNICFPDCVDLT